MWCNKVGKKNIVKRKNLQTEKKTPKTKQNLWGDSETIHEMIFQTE